jgi:hypothetical protein
MPSHAPRPRSVAKAKVVDYRKAATLLKHASDPTRLLALLILAEGEQNVGAMCGMIGLRGMASFSTQLANMRHGGIVSQRRQWQNNFYILTDRGRRLVEAARALLE